MPPPCICIYGHTLVFISSKLRCWRLLRHTAMIPPTSSQLALGMLTMPGKVAIPRTGRGLHWKTFWAPLRHQVYRGCAVLNVTIRTHDSCPDCNDVATALNLMFHEINVLVDELVTSPGCHALWFRAVSCCTFSYACMNTCSIEEG